MTASVSLAEKLAGFDEHYAPRIVARYNENKVCVVKVLGEFVWHAHPDTDDFFLVLDGLLAIDLEDGPAVRTVELGPGELLVVPRGVRHRPRADVETHVLLIEPEGTANTGDSVEREAAPEREA